MVEEVSALKSGSITPREIMSKSDFPVHSSWGEKVPHSPLHHYTQISRTAIIQLGLSLICNTKQIKLTLCYSGIADSNYAQKKGHNFSLVFFSKQETEVTTSY